MKHRRTCRTCSESLAPDNRTDRCHECRLIDANRHADLIERGRQLLLGEHQGDSA